MSTSNCVCRLSCTTLAVIVSLILGIVAAFLQITGIITVTPAFLWVALGIAVVYLVVLVGAAALDRGTGTCGCKCTVVNVLLVGILGTILFSVVLLAVGTAASVTSAVLVGLLLFGLALTFTETACLVRCLAGCSA